MPLWRDDRALVLASRSETRQAILRAAGIPIDVHPADIDERAAEEGAPPGGAAAAAALLAREKAGTIAARLPGRLVLGADQILTLGARRFSKPENVAAARAQLCALRGQAHELCSAVAIVRHGLVLFEHRETARLTMRAFSDEFLDDYLDAAGAAVTASVGSYQVEGAGIQLFERIDGDHFAILGLPLVALLQFLRQSGWLAS